MSTITTKDGTQSAANPEGLPIEVFDKLRTTLPGTSHSSTRIWRYRSMALIGRALKSHKARWISSGFGACKLAS